MRPEFAAGLLNFRQKNGSEPLAAVCVGQSHLFEPLLETKTETSIEMPSNRMKERMMKPGILGAAVALAFMAGPAMAKQAISSPAHYAQSIYCATREAGNPYKQVLRLHRLERLAAARRLGQPARRCLLA